MNNFPDFTKIAFDVTPARVSHDEWRARFERVTVTIAYESTGGNKPGDQLDGVVCPACGGIEFNDYLLSINHGWDPGDFEQARYGLYGRPAFETCTKLEYGDGHKRDGIGVVRLLVDADAAARPPLAEVGSSLRRPA